jgi:hypothetical protein
MMDRTYSNVAGDKEYKHNLHEVDSWKMLTLLVQYLTTPSQLRLYNFGW